MPKAAIHTRTAPVCNRRSTGSISGANMAIVYFFCEWVLLIVLVERCAMEKKRNADRLFCFREKRLVQAYDPVRLCKVAPKKTTKKVQADAKGYEERKSIRVERERNGS